MKIARRGQRPRTGDQPKQRRQGDIDQWTGGDAPQGRARPLRRIDVSDAAKRPEHDGIGGSAHRAAGERMTELVRQNNGKEGEILDNIPRDGAISPLPSFDFIKGDEEP
jgi:hypothetical protein